MFFSTRLFAIATAFLVTNVAAQTFTLCNPLNETCPSDLALGTTASWNFSNSAIADSVVWNTTAGDINWALDGAEFTVNGKGDSPTIQSNFYILFGRVSVVMKAAPGVGVVSSIVLLSDDLDEIDWEFIGGNKTYGETNYFGKDNTTSYDRAKWYPVEDTVDTWHNYSTTWTAENTTWYIDGKAVRTLQYADALNGKNYPQTPMTVRLGIWVGGDPSENSNGTVEWAGGETNYADGPFTMTVQSLEIEDFSHGSSYTYGDKTGDWQSIKIASGNSTIADRLNTPRGVTNKFKSLPKAAQIAIAAVVLSVAVILVVLMAVCCIRSRKAGRRERALADAQWEKEQSELQQYKRMLVSEEELHPRARGGYI